ncbi:DUF397 domain-containing protein [Streptomyces longwoodensis]|uniref:DUF397 domain-containing protein n=1 Tax=Streptomyces longwoodensis TaxID=68231 RepID=UPI0036FB2EAD
MNETPGAAGEQPWRRSSYSGGAGGECVEVALLPHAVRVRDSKDTSRALVPVTASAWSAFLKFAVR